MKRINSDQLGSDLENFCTSAFDIRYITDPIPPNQATPYNSNIKMRGLFILVVFKLTVAEHSKPPPPARRNSTITAATPTAPSVADARSNYFKGASLIYRRVYPYIGLLLGEQKRGPYLLDRQKDSFKRWFCR